jgi:hypothetical protein
MSLIWSCDQSFGGLKNTPARTFRRCILLDFSPPDFLDAIMDQLRNIECINADLGLWNLLPRPGMKGFGHVHRDVLDRVRMSFMTHEINLEAFKSFGLSTFGRADHATGGRVMKNGNITQWSTQVFLIDSQQGDFTVIACVTGRLHMDIDGPPDAIPNIWAMAETGRFLARVRTKASISKVKPLPGLVLDTSTWVSLPHWLHFTLGKGARRKALN